MPTAIGIIFALASIGLFFLEDDSLFVLTVFSSIFTSSSIISLSSAGIAPFYFVASLFALQSIYRGAFSSRSSYRFQGKKWMIVFIFYCVISAITLPFIFRGIPVYDPHLGIDLGFFVQNPLHFTHTNISHCIFLLVDGMVVWGASRKFTGNNHAERAYLLCFYFLVIIILLQVSLPLVGIDFPYSILQNNAGVDISTVDSGSTSARYAGTFTEPSGAGEVLACCTAGFIAGKLRSSRALFPALIGLAAIGLVRSSGAILAVSIAILMLVLSTPVFRRPYFVNLRQLLNIFLVISVICAIAAIALFSPLRQSLIDLTLNKSESGSYLHRIAADGYALSIFVRTHGLGVGLGSNRPSSLITSLLSTIGIPGFILFFGAYFAVLRNARVRNPWLIWAGIALIIDMISSGPDYDAPWLWCVLAIAVRIGCTTDGGSKDGGLPASTSRSLPSTICRHLPENM
ncbi:MAG TPA: hypothetical protein VG844_16325 [Terracidiphilus sp.]|nr:hypothetical protein [Terracidiphilus sp.]